MKTLILIVFSLILYSCSPYLTRNTGPVKHTYVLNISSDEPSNEVIAKVKCSLLQKDLVKRDTSITKKLPISVTLNYDVLPDEQGYSFERYKTELKYSIEIPEHFYYEGSESNDYDASSYSIDKPVVEKKVVLSPKQYKLIIHDIDGLPVENAKVEYKLKSNSKIVKEKTVFTDANGIIKDFTYDNSNKGYLDIFSNYSLDYDISKDGYYPKTGTMSSSNLTEEINLIKPIDYLDKEFVLSSKGEKLKANTIKFIDLILLQSLLSESYLELQSINLVPFKEKDYLTFKFINTNSYNSLKLNKYDIGKLLFDDVIRKILNPLNDYLGESKEFYGYDLVVVGHTKSFADKYASDEKINYRFLIPNDIVKKYKNKDISGQQVLDASVILMDDERIDLKLQ